MALPSYSLVRKKMREMRKEALGITSSFSSYTMFFPVAETTIRTTEGRVNTVGLDEEERAEFLAKVGEEFGITIPDDYGNSGERFGDLPLYITREMHRQDSPRIDHYTIRARFPEITDGVIGIVKEYTREHIDEMPEIVSTEVDTIDAHTSLGGIFGQDFHKFMMLSRIRAYFGVDVMGAGIERGISHNAFWGLMTPSDAALVIASEKGLEGAPPKGYAYKEFEHYVDDPLFIDRFWDRVGMNMELADKANFGRIAP